MSSSATLRSGRGRQPLPRAHAPAWSRDTAYATGLVATDGYITEPTYVGFGSTDRDLIETFLHCVDRPLRYSTTPAGRPGNIAGHEFKSKRDYHMTYFSDPPLYRFFEAAGITPRKSLTLAGLMVPTEHLPDVIRGLLDGDGSVMVVPKRWRGAARTYEKLCLRVVFYSGSRAHVEWLRAVFADLAIRSSIQENRRGTNPVFQLVLSEKQATTLLSTLYQDPRAPRLRRKWLIWSRYRQLRSLPEFYGFL